jgi:hypothetical protein
MALLLLAKVQQGSNWPTPSLLLQRVGQCCPVTSEQVPGNGSTRCYVMVQQDLQTVL